MRSTNDLEERRKHLATFQRNCGETLPHRVPRLRKDLLLAMDSRTTFSQVLDHRLLRTVNVSTSWKERTPQKKERIAIAQSPGRVESLSDRNASLEASVTRIPSPRDYHHHHRQDRIRPPWYGTQFAEDPEGHSLHRGAYTSAVRARVKRCPKYPGLRKVAFSNPMYAKVLSYWP